MSKKYGLLEAPVHFFRKDFLHDVAINWRGLALSYLLLLCLYCSLFDGHMVHRYYQETHQKVLENQLKKLPELSFDGQILSFKNESENKIFEFKDYDDKTLLKIDLNEEVKELEGSVVIGKEFVFSNSLGVWWKGSTKDFLKFWGHFGLDISSMSHTEQKAWFTDSIRFSFLTIVVLVAFGHFLVQLFNVLIFTTLLYFMWKMISPDQFLRNLSFKPLFRLTLVTYTPVMIIQTLLRYFDYTNQFWEIVFTVAHVLFIHYACVAAQDGGEAKSE